MIYDDVQYTTRRDIYNNVAGQMYNESDIAGKD